MTTPERSAASATERTSRRPPPLKIMMAAAVCALSLGVARCATTPNAEVAVPWPDQAVKVRIQIWGFLAPQYWVAVESPEGRISRQLWTNWGPADQANLYLTPEGSLAVIGGGALAAMIEAPAHAPPREVRPFETSDAEDWRYLGRAAWVDGALRFRAASEHRECIPLYGAGDVPVRRKYQARGSYC